MKYHETRDVMTTQRAHYRVMGIMGTAQGKLWFMVDLGFYSNSMQFYAMSYFEEMSNFKVMYAANSCII